MTNAAWARVLFEEVPPELISELKELTIEHRQIWSSTTKIDGDFDVLVTFSDELPDRPTHLHVISFGAVELGEIEHLTDTRYAKLVKGDELTEGPIKAWPAAPDEFGALISSTLVGKAVGIRDYAWAVQDGDTNLQISRGDLDGFCQPLAHFPGEEVAALFALRAPEVEKEAAHEGWLLALPRWVEQKADWVRAFLDYVQDDASTDEGWKSGPDWATPPLRDALVVAAEMEVERDQLLSELDGRTNRAKALVTAEMEVADTGIRRLLTDNGQELEEVVADALRDLGFNVEAMDSHHESTNGARLEDFRVTDPEAPEWICLAEVKGYSKGARVNDVAKIFGRPVAKYILETGRIPSALWHVVNTFRAADPSTRPKAIPNPDVDLAILTQNDGAVIDTRDLFRAWVAVKDDPTRTSSIRFSLRSARSIWTFEQSEIEAKP